MGDFEKKDIVYGLESKLSRDMLEKSMKKFRVSKDFCVAKNTIVKPKEINIVQIRLEKSLFPDVDIITP
jgi:hypothetical protein